MYLAIGTRPDIAHAVQQPCRHLDCYGPVHWDAAKRVVRYLQGSRDLHLILGGDRPARLMGYTDSDYANRPDTRRSVSGYFFYPGLGHGNLECAPTEDCVSVHLRGGICCSF
jgi:hypothetical protein